MTVHTFHGHVLEGYFNRPVQSGFIGAERWLAKRTDALVAVSEHVRDELLDLGIGTPERFHVIPLGFDLRPFLAVDGPSGELRGRLGLSEDVPFVGVLGRLVPIKDHATLVRTVARLEGVHLAVLGDGELRDRLLAQVRALKIQDRVHFVGWVTNVADALADMDVVALSSRNEGTPVSLIEAGASARPVVSTDVGGVRAVVRDGETGLLVPPGDDEALAQAVRRLLGDRELSRAFGEAARDHVRVRFAQERLVADVHSLYAALLERR